MFQIFWWAFGKVPGPPPPPITDQLVASAIGPQSIPPLQVAFANSQLLVTFPPTGLQVAGAQNKSLVVTVLTNPLIGS